MEQIVSADIAAFGQGRAAMANAMIEQSGVRIGEDRRRGRGAGVNPSGRFEPTSPPRLRRRLGTRSRNCRRSRPRCRSRSRAPSSPATSRPTFPSTARSTPIAAASMAASTASRGRPTPIWACRRGSTSNRSCSPSRMPRACSKRNSPRKATSRARSPSAPTPIPTSRSRSSTGSCARCWKCWRRTSHPVGIVTKSALVVRDIDILSRMAERGLAKVALSVTTLDRHLARNMEPRAATPTKRLEAIRQLTEAGIPTSVMVAPIIPGLTDQEIERILDSARNAGAREAGYVHPAAAAGGQPDLQGLAAAPLSRTATGT